MKLLFAVIFVSIFTVRAVDEKFINVGTDKCTVEAFKEAQDKFATKLGLPTEDNWQQPLVMFKAIQDYYANDPDAGLVKVCNAFNSLISFLNDEKNIDVKTCYDPLFLLGSDKTPEDAIHFLGVVRSLRFQCGAGFYPIIHNDNWKCTSTVYKTYNDQIVNALTTIIQNSEKDRINRCEIIKNNELKFYKPFHDICANPEITYFGCQTYHSFFNGIYPECTTECKIIA